MPRLNVWMNGELVGSWSTTRAGNSVLAYAEQWRASPYARPLSLSLPMAPGDLRGARVDAYFENLLPDSAEVRQRLSVRFRTRSTSAFDLLSAIGRDCVGAVQLLPPEATPAGFDRIDSEPMDDAAVERWLRAVPQDAPPPVEGENAVEEDLRFSLAGAQEKSALLKIGSRWHMPRGATPTTHILKLPLGLVGNLKADMRDSIENEWLCAQLLRELGLAVANSELVSFGDQKALAVERFDRRWMNVPDGAAARARFRPPPDAWIARLPQEDLCQATATPPRLKYEAEGGPGMQACLDLLGGSARAEHDRLQFVSLQLVFWLLAATDGHAKNFSIAHQAGGTYQLTPAYDVLSAWPIIGNGAHQVSPFRAKLAMALRGRNPHWKLREILPRHWQGLASQISAQAWDQLRALVERSDAALARVEAALPAEFPERVWRAVSRGVAAQRRTFLAARG